MFSNNCRVLCPRLFRHTAWPPSPANITRLNSFDTIEEEKTPYYDAGCFYPARLGQVLNGRYQLATKVGFGSSSTVWLARDLHRLLLWRWFAERYVAIKINTTDCSTSENERSIFEHISRQTKSHDGHNFIRKLLGSFTVRGVSGTHVCLVLEPLREPLWLYCRRFVGGVIPADILKILLQMILQGLDYLHSECQIIHTGMNPHEYVILEKDALDEYCNPLPQKIDENRTIYLSRNNYGPLLRPTGIVQIGDYGLSVSGKMEHTGCIQAEAYRAPEVILDAGYGYSADIWSLGNRLFDPISSQNGDDYDDLSHLAQITALLGPPPNTLLAAGRRSSMFYESNGGFRHLSSHYYVPHEFQFDSRIHRISGEEKQKFLEFATKMIQWRPEERHTAKELLRDPWLYTDYPQI
ncbi:protein kinase [Cordyceps javanica]|uniref:non-specific serine/threonine protein kinase n=1 Tax=Cordyceps javanica TaxID=43265 RepID=A0A545VFF8_9HYPO|nr:protein kinase [Cordyceps javanica]